MIPPLKHKSGTALVIVLGFLAILTLTIIAFSTQTRSERLAGRAHTASAQTRHLLHAALSRAMEDIDISTNSNYPDFFVFGSRGDEKSWVARTLIFDLEEDYFTAENDLIAPPYKSEFKKTEWQTIHTQGDAIGRVGYMVINSSGLLDANRAGGLSPLTDYKERKAGTSPQEIQLSNALLSEFSNSSATDNFPHINSDTPKGTLRSASNIDLSPGLAFVYNRENAWRRYESLRDVYTLNQISSPDIITAPIENFSTFSYSPPDEDKRTFMGTNTATLANDVIKRELGAISAITDTSFVMNQLRDYLDQDSYPENENGEYTDYSVEPVPLINELVLTFNFSFVPVMSEDTADNGETISIVESVIISNRYSLEIEVWYPFVGYEAQDAFSVHLDEVPDYEGTISSSFLKGITNWTGAFNIPQEALIPGADPYDILIYAGKSVTEVSSTNEMISLFEELQSDIYFSAIFCTNVSQSKLVDRVIGLELPMENAVANDLVPDMAALASEYFDSGSSLIVSNQFVAGMACVDPRLNWDGESIEQWVEEIEVNNTATIATLGEVNSAVIQDFSNTPDEPNKIFVRNTDKIDTPWEFTYFLYSTNKPWKTFQMMEVHDDDDTRQILQNLSPYADAPPLHGRINPYSPHKPVIASGFFNVALDDYNLKPSKQLTAAQAQLAADKFMNYYSTKSWPTQASNYGTNIFEIVLEDLNTWEQEGFFRNTYELFNPRDTLFTVLLAAQDGTDFNTDGTISDDEVRSTQQAVVYIWRDPETSRAACVFYGLSSTLRKATGQGAWGNILNEFRP